MRYRNRQYTLSMPKRHERRPARRISSPAEDGRLRAIEVALALPKSHDNAQYSAGATSREDEQGSLTDLKR